LPTQINPKASAIFVVSLCRKSFLLFVILAWRAVGGDRRIFRQSLEELNPPSEAVEVVLFVRCHTPG
jgi:hypothetical protein